MLDLIAYLHDAIRLWLFDNVANNAGTCAPPDCLNVQGKGFVDVG